jgi:hypothetical protein
MQESDDRLCSENENLLRYFATTTYNYFLLLSHLSLSIKKGLVTDLSAWEMTEMKIT